ncbi:flotillin family protein [Aureivirga marina]|uniref:flotillin family protein n=1 Tax=Aureivirga marina TaxID=1182451 RepID=UPI0018CA0E3E|nr:flotillin family protein [Aureivirga marina]
MEETVQELGTGAYAGYFTLGLIAFAIIVFLVIIIKMYNKAAQGEVLVRTGGFGGVDKKPKVSSSGLISIPVLHRLEKMDIRVKTITISRTGSEGLICKDNMRADIKVTFFVRVNVDKVAEVAKSIGCDRASDPETLRGLYEPKFAEALKTVGKQFEFVELYTSRREFNQAIVNIIGTDLNGYKLEDCAIDFLEQTPINELDESNILDAEGIKKIIELTAEQKVQSNLVERDKEKTIKQQDVEAQETILNLEKQKVEAEERQKREIENIKAREQSEVDRINEEERLKAEKARIATEEQIQIAEENRMREVIVAEKNKEKIEAIEAERVEQARLLEETEKTRIVELAQIEKQRAIEIEQKNIQDVIRERVSVEKAVVEEQEKIKDTQALAKAERDKVVALKNAEQEAESALVKKIKEADAAKEASKLHAEKMLIDAKSKETAAIHDAEATKILAEAAAAEAAAIGMSEAQVMEAKAEAREKEAAAEAAAVEATAHAEAKGIEVKGIAQAEADKKIGEVAAQIEREKGLAQAEVIQVQAEANEKQGLVDVRILNEKLEVEAEGIRKKADAMKILDPTSVAHEEFRLRLEQAKEIELARIDANKDIAASQAGVLAEALQSSNIDIIGGESMFFDKLTSAITTGKAIDKAVGNSEVLQEVKGTFFNGENGNGFKENFKMFIDQFGVNSEDLKNLTISALLYKLMQQTQDEDSLSVLNQLQSVSKMLGVSDKTPASIGLN